MKPKKLFLIFIISLLAVISFIAASFFLLYERTTDRQLISYGEMSLDNSILYVNTIIQSTKDLFDSLSLDADISKLLNYDSLSANELLVGLRRLEKYKASSYFIDSIYIYNRDDDTVYVSSDYMTEASYRLSDFPDSYAAEVMLSYDGIGNMEPVFRTYDVLSPRPDTVNYLSFIRYNTLNKKNTSNVMMVNIRQDLMARLIHTSSGNEGELLAVVDRNGSYKVIAGNKDIVPQSFAASVMKRIGSGENEFVDKNNGKKYIICSSKVFNDSNILVFISDENTLLNNIQRKYYGNSLVLLGVFMGISILLLVLIFKRIWAGIDSALKKASIEEERKREIEKSIERSRILAVIHSEASIETLFPESDEQKIVIVLCVIDSYDKQIAMKYEKRSEREGLKEEICSEIKDFSPILTVYEDDARCMALFKDSGRVTELKEHLENKFDISITVFLAEEIAVSNIQETYAFLSDSIPYGMLIGCGKVITLPMIEEREMTVYSIPENAMRDLSDDILKLNIPGALATVELILREIAHSSYRSAQLAILNLSVLIDDAISRIHSNNGIEAASMPGALFYKFQHLDSLSEIYECIKKLLEQTENSVALNKNNRQSDLVNNIIEIIHENYLNRDFSIITVSETLGMSASYLGKVFKKTTGESFSRYVLNERMKESCRKLAETDEPIDSIVYSVGFGDTPYFYKLFKQINGCTPTKYREEHRGRM